MCDNSFPSVCHSRESGNPDEFQGFCFSLIDKIVIITQPLYPWEFEKYRFITVLRFIKCCINMKHLKIVVCVTSVIHY